MLKAVISFICSTFFIHALLSIICCIVLHFKPNCIIAFKLLARFQAPFFGLTANCLSRVCNLEYDCKDCRYWTCSNFHK